VGGGIESGRLLHVHGHYQRRSGCNILGSNGNSNGDGTTTTVHAAKDTGVR
jgi:hypothetical protein